MKKLLVLALTAVLSGCAAETPKPAEKAPEPAAKADPIEKKSEPEAKKEEPAKAEPAKTDGKTEAPKAAGKTDGKSDAKSDAKAPEKPAAPAAAPKAAAASDAVPDIFKVQFTTSKGDFVIEVHRLWAPLGAARFYELAKGNFFDDARFFRVISGFMVQFGISPDPKVAATWREKNIKDDPVMESNTRGMVTFATGGPNTRTTQMFISYGNNARLDRDGFSPFGKVISGMEVVDSLYSGYGEGAPGGRGPEQGRIQMEGNTYLKAQFPMLDYIKTARIVK